MPTPPPGTSYPTGTISPYLNGSELALINLTSVVAACLPTTLLDEDGHPLAVGVRTDNGEDLLTAPEVVVDFAEGESGQYAGDNLLSYDNVANIATRGQEYENSDVTLTVRGRNDAERRYLMDALRFGLVAGYGVPDPPPVDNRIEAVAMVGLRQVGFSRWRFQRSEYPRPVQTEDRPQGLVFPAVLHARCSLWMVWTTPGVVAPPGHVYTVFTPGPVDGGGSTPLLVGIYGVSSYGECSYAPLF